MYNCAKLRFKEYEKLSMDDVTTTDHTSTSVENGWKKEENLPVDGWNGAKLSQMWALECESVTQSCHKCGIWSLKVWQGAEKWPQQSSSLTSSSNGEAVEFAITGQYGATFSHKISPWSYMVLELYLVAKPNTSIYPGSDGEIGLGDYSQILGWL